MVGERAARQARHLFPAPGQGPLRFDVNISSPRPTATAIQCRRSSMSCHLMMWEKGSGRCRWFRSDVEGRGTLHCLKTQARSINRHCTGCDTVFAKFRPAQVLACCCLLGCCDPLAAAAAALPPSLPQPCRARGSVSGGEIALRLRGRWGGCSCGTAGVPIPLQPHVNNVNVNGRFI